MSSPFRPLPFRLLGVAAVVASLVTPAQAQTVPSLFRVVNVESGDALNVRPTAGTSGAAIDRLPPGTSNVEVAGLNADGTWGRVNRGETAGWVRMRYMAEQPGVWMPAALPPTLRCFGTEPFWSIRHDGARLTLSGLEGEDAGIPITAIHDTSPRGRSVIAGEGTVRLTLAITPAQCSDGMSDQAFGLSAAVTREIDGQSTAMNGCCSLQPR